MIALLALLTILVLIIGGMILHFYLYRHGAVDSPRRHATIPL